VQMPNPKRVVGGHAVVAVDTMIQKAVHRAQLWAGMGHEGIFYTPAYLADRTCRTISG
jgi:hypothetical protein